jgi:hypothetical protein
MQIHFSDAYELLTSGSDYLKRVLQHESAGCVMGLHAERMSEEEIVLLEEEVLPAIGRFIERAEAIWEARERLRAQQARRQPEVLCGLQGADPKGGPLELASGTEPHKVDRSNSLTS